MSEIDEPSPSSSFLSAEEVCVSFTSRAVLQDVSLGIGNGEFVAILGPSGCGKSTLLRLVAGLLTPSSGSLLVSGMHPEMARRTSQRVAFVFQDPHLLPWRTVAGNIALPLELTGASSQDQVRAVRDSLALIGLTPDDARKRPRNLSGGMRMRVSLARALVTNPNLLLLDEPFAALDEVLRQQLNEELVRVWRSQGWTGLFVTHNVSEAVFLAQRVLVMSPRPGTVIADIRIPFDYPREPSLRANPDFARLCLDLSQRLREGAA